MLLLIIYIKYLLVDFAFIQAHIQRVLHDHFLFRRLTESQSQVLLDCMQRVEVNPGDVVVQQVCA